MADEPTPRQCRILVMASGNGSNFQGKTSLCVMTNCVGNLTNLRSALIDAVASGVIPSSRIIRLVVNRSKAFATTRSERAGIPWEYFNLVTHGFLPKGEKDEAKVAAAREKYDAALAQKIVTAPDGEKPDLVVLAGWMHVFGRSFLEPLEKHGIKTINLHPALPGEYNGAGAIERAFGDFKAGRITRTGIMVHYVVLEVDMGEPILTREVEIREGDDLAALEERMHASEHELIVQATAKVARALTETAS